MRTQKKRKLCCERARRTKLYIVQMACVESEKEAEKSARIVKGLQQITREVKTVTLAAFGWLCARI